jgi:predicted ATPase/transcriptional regulator with XRE-family HTH domain
MAREGGSAPKTGSMPRESSIDTGASFGLWLKRRRRVLDLTQDALAQQVGCSLATIQKIEADERRPSRQIAELLANALDIPTKDRLLFLKVARGERATDGLAPIPGPVEEPLLKGTGQPAYRASLPSPLTPLIGRENELAALARVLHDKQRRLVTLVGPGGIGKTRLAQQVAADCANDFEDGVVWVELAALTDASLLPQVVASALGVLESPHQPISQTLSNHLRAKRLLLALDNCEHLIAPCSELAETLLNTCPGLKLLATSREVLGLAGEVVWTVAPLAWPNQQGGLSVRELVQYDAVRFFCDRALAVRRDFLVTDHNASAILQICNQLEGMPLALELAASRVKILAVEQIAAHLNDHLALLTEGRRTAPARQQTLRATMDWSYDLLSEAERHWLCQLSVFAGGWTLEAAQAVCVNIGSAPVDETLDGLSQLANKSLLEVEQQGERTRYRLLETIRQYAHNKLSESGELELVRARHFDFFLKLAEEAEPHFTSAEWSQWLDRMKAEQDNFRAALEWGQAQNGSGESMIRLAGALYWFWNRRSWIREGRYWLDSALARMDDSVTALVRAKLLYGAGSQAYDLGDNRTAQGLLEQSIRLSRSLGKAGGHTLAHGLSVWGWLLRDAGNIAEARAVTEESVGLFRDQEDSWGLAHALQHLGMVIRDHEDYGLARSILEESLAVWQETGDRWGVAGAYHQLGLVDLRQGDYSGARLWLENGLALRRESGNLYGVAYSILSLGVVALNQEDLAHAKLLFEEGQKLFGELGAKFGVASSLQYEGYLALFGGDVRRAQALFEQSLALAREAGPEWLRALGVARLAGVAALRDQPARAVRLWSAAEALMKASASYMDTADRLYYERTVAHVKANLSDAEFAQATAAGRAMTLEEAVVQALQPIR